MLVHDLEFAVKHVSPQKEIGYIGTVKPRSNVSNCLSSVI